MGFAAFGIVAHSAYRSLSSQVVVQSSGIASGGSLPSDLSFEGIKGEKLLAQDLGGRVAVINFWAGWCAPCISEMPGLYAFFRKYEQRGLEVVAVNMDDDPLQGIGILERKVGRAPFPVYKGSGTGLADRFEIEGLPFTVVVSRDGHVIYSKAGAVDWTKSQVVSLIEGVL